MSFQSNPTTRDDLFEKTGILDIDRSLTILPVDLSLLNARLILFSSSTLKDPTGIFEGITGFSSASCSLALAWKRN